MPVSLNQFTRDLVHSRVLSADEVSEYIEAMPSDSRPGDGEALAKALVRDGKLTRFQAKTIYRGNPIPLILGEYRLQDKIGQGGMGQVLKAVHCRLDRSVAIKVLSPEALASEDAVRRFHQEVMVAAQLTHPNIVSTHDAGDQDGTLYLVMEFVEGVDLSTHVATHGPMAVEQAVDCLIQTAQGLDYAHGKRVIHRDIKPANLLLDSAGTVKILDMGLARIDEPLDAQDVGATMAQRLTRQGEIMGTVDYMSPEQAMDTSSVDHRSDIYSLGCTLYRLLTGRSVFQGATAMLMMMAHCEAEIPSLAESPTPVPAKLDSVFRKMLAKKPAERYQTFAELITDLQACLEPDLPCLTPVAQATTADDRSVSSDVTMTCVADAASNEQQEFDLAPGVVSTMMESGKTKPEKTKPEKTKPEKTKSDKSKTGKATVDNDTAKQDLQNTVSIQDDSSDAPTEGESK